jgi:hypothetical protein
MIWHGHHGEGVWVMMRFWLRMIGVLVMLGCCVARAEEVPDAPLLVVEAPDGTERTYSREALEAMRQVSYRTSTIWTDGVIEFRGVPLSEIMKEAGVTSGRIVLRASNDYSAEMPLSSVTSDIPMIALMMDGKPMTLREKGPLWLVYPYDLSDAYQSEVVYTRSIWQLVKIEVQP